MKTSEGATCVLGTKARKKRGSFISLDQKRTRSTKRLVRSERRATWSSPRVCVAFSNASLWCQHAGENNAATSARPCSLQRFHTARHLTEFVARSLKRQFSGRPAFYGSVHRSGPTYRGYVR